LRWLSLKGLVNLDFLAICSLTRRLVSSSAR